MKTLKEKTEEQAAVMKAFVDGASIEVMSKGAIPANQWMSATYPCWDWDSCDYRVKPTPKRKLYKFARLINGRWEDTTTYYENEAEALILCFRSEKIIRLDYTMIEVD